MYLVEIGIIVIVTASIYLHISFKQRAVLRNLAYRDSITKTFNRNGMLYYMKSCKAKRAHAVLYIDLDHFKEINDTWGHETGDQLLRTATRRIRQATGNSDLIFRVGGDEFIVLVQTKYEAQAQKIASAILEQFSRPIGIEDRSMVLSASIGVSSSRRGVRLGPNLIKEADLAMYHAKQKGRNQIVFANRDENNPDH
ncbi:GGDEF domain-containing protein [Paenibacillus turicensis]|nr:GGDEF domain-containing protein [Paenibacillus turicensis]